jgi:hypothetical protein
MDLHKCTCALSLGFLFMTVTRRKPFLNILKRINIIIRNEITINENNKILKNEE